MDIEAIRKRLKDNSKKKKKKVEEEVYLNSGCTLLNLALTGDPFKGFLTGKYYWYVGDSESGKTFFTLSALAEASIDSRFDNYHLIYDDAEGGALMDKERFFGTELFKRIQPPRRDSKNKPLHSEKVEDFFYTLDDYTEAGMPFVYVLDSMDSVSSESEEGSTKENKKRWEKGLDKKGNYGDGKAKINSSNLRQFATSKLAKTNSILVVVSQTRDNVGGGIFEPKKIYSGGNALRFYASAQIWTSVKGPIKRTVRKKDRVIGQYVKISIKKNRLSGQKMGTITVPFYPNLGIDDVGACVDFLQEEGHWTGDKKVIAEEFDFSGSKEKLIQKIEEEGREDELREITGKVWNEIVEACKVERKQRY